jgi:hypothetical protein
MEIPVKCPHCGLVNPSTAQRCDCGHDFDKEALMDQGMSPVETGPIGIADQGWLWAARCSALISFLITLIGAFTPGAGLLTFSIAAWWLLSLGQLGSLFCRGKNPLAFGLGMGAAMVSIALIGTHYYGSPWLVGLFVIGGPLLYFFKQPWLFWPVCISLLTLGVSAVVVFTKMRDEGNGGRRPRLAFGAGIFCTLVGCFAISILFSTFWFFWMNFHFFPNARP